MINQLTKNIKLFLILLLLSSFVAVNTYEPKKSSLVKNILEFETTSDFIPDEIEPFCGGVSYTEANSKSLYDVSYLNINLIEYSSTLLV